MSRRRGLIQRGVQMKAIVVTDEAAGTAGMTLGERPEPPAAINDVIVQIHASGFVPTEMAWPSTWTDRRDCDRTPSVPGHELAGVVAALGYGTTGVSVGQRVLGLADWHRDGTLAEYVAIEARNLAPLPGDVDFTVGASLPISGLTAWQGLFDHGRLQAGQTVLAHGAAGAVGPPEARPADGLAVDFVVESDRAQLSEIVQRVRDGRLRTNIGDIATLDDAVAALNPTERRSGKTIIRVRP